MAGSKSDRVTDAKFDIFSSNPDGNDSIRVGYIDSKRGYISGLSVYEANKYAEKNPGTQFILATRDKVIYLNINGVNELTNEKILPINRPKGIVSDNDGELDPCNTVRGFATSPEIISRSNANGPDDRDPIIEPPEKEGGGRYNTDNNYKKYKKDKVRVELQGGGGVGAVASPIIGLDGSIIHCRVIEGGFGYRNAPQVRIVDDSFSGSGAKAYSLLGTIGYTFENYDDEDDVENYDFDLGEYNFDPIDASWGSIYNLGTQTVIGEWNPGAVISLTNPDGGFASELLRYLDFLKGYDPNKPWWTTRDENVVKVSGNKKHKIANGLGTVLFPVEHHAWGGDRTLDDLFVDVEFEVYGQGTYKNRNISFKFEAEDGSHQFRVKGVTHEKRSGKRRNQIVSVKANTNYTVTSNVRKKIKNADKIAVEQGLAKQLGGTREDGQKQRDGGKSRIIFADVVGSANDDDDIQVRSDIGSFKAGSREKISVDIEGIQNKNIKIKTNIEKLEARQTDLLLKLEMEKKDTARDPSRKWLYDIVSNKVDDVAAELKEERKKKKELREKLKEIEENKNNRYKRGSFDLTYRINRRKDKTFTTEITDSFMNKYAVSPELPSNVEGTDRAGKPYSLMYKEYFPHDGKYKFRGAADNIGEVFLDGVLIMDISNRFKQSSKNVTRTVTKGLHEIRIDLENKVQKRTIEKTYTSDGAKDVINRKEIKFKVVSSGSKTHRKINCIFTNKNNPSDCFVITHDGTNKEVRTVNRQVTTKQKYDVKFVPTAERKTKEQKEFNIKYEGLNPANQGPVNSIDVSGSGKTIKLKDGDGNDANASFRIMPGSPGTSAKFSSDGRSLNVKGSGEVTLRLEWDDNPNTGGVAVRSISIGGKKFRQKGKKGDQTEIIKVNNVTESFVLEQGTIKNGTKNKEGGRTVSNKIFGDYVGSANDNDDMQIFVTKGGEFVATKKSKVTGESTASSKRRGTQTRGTYELEFIFKTQTTTRGLQQNLKELVRNETGQSIERSDIELAEVFNTKKYIDKADRTLYRVKPNVGGFGDFFSKLAVTPFNPLEVDPEIIDVKPIEKPAPVEKPKVKFERKGGPTGDLFMKVTGVGKVLIGFILKVDDNPGTSGSFASKVKIGRPPNDYLLLERSKSGGKYREKETIKGSAVFEAGREYPVTTIGGSQTSGFKTVDRTIVFDDNYQNGWDKNGKLKIDFIEPVASKKSIPEPQAAKNGGNNPSKKVSLDCVEGSADAYAGIHKIVWDDIDFPYDGTYNVDVQVDDNVRIEIFNRKFQAQVIDVKGFPGKGRRNNVVQSFIIEVKKGKYKLRAFLEQIPGKSIVDGNPMGLAIKIKTVYATVKEEIILNKSWNQNPFGVALAIHAPLPKIPQELPLEQEGPCPPNPIWTTRSTGFIDQWHPCSHRRPGGGRTWSKFMNRYAMSPVIPIGAKGSGYSGQQWTNTWTAKIPFTGFYNFKGTSDNKSSCIISQTPVDDATSEVSQNRSVKVKKINHFRTEKKDLTSNKIFLEKGTANIEITVENGERIRTREVTRKVFSTSDWLSKPVKKDGNRIPIEFKVYGQGSKNNMEIKAIFKEKGGDHTFTINNVEKNKTTETIKKRVKANTDYKVTFVPTSKTITEKITERKYPIEVAAPGTNGRGDKAAIVKVTDNKIIYTDTTDQLDNDAEFKILPPSPGVTAKFSRDGSELIVKGDGDVSLELSWNDDPNSNGKAVGNIKVAGKTWKQTSHQNKKDAITKTITVGKSTSAGTTSENITKIFPLTYTNLNSSNNPIEVTKSGQTIRLKDGDGSDQNAVIRIENVEPEGGGTAKFTDDGRGIEVKGNVTVTINLDVDDNPNTAGVALDAVEINGVTFNRIGSKGEDAKLVRFNATRQVDIKPIATVTTTTDNGILEQGCMAKGFGRADVKKEGGGQTDPSNIVFADYVRSKNDNNDMMIQCTTGIFTPSNKHRTEKANSNKDGRRRRRGTWDLTYRFDDAVFEVLEPITEIDGVIYEVKDKEVNRSATTRGGGTNNSRIIENTDSIILNPTLATYKRGSDIRTGRARRLLSPFFPKGRKESGENLQGRTWEMIWEDVKFPINGEYKFEIEVDDSVIIEVSTDKVELDSDASMTTKNNVKYQTIRTARGRGTKIESATIQPGKRNVKLTLQNLKISGTSFNTNPTYVDCKITCKEPVEIGDQRSWLVNPVGVSAVLISPPCKRLVGGGHTVSEIQLVQEGNSYPPPDNPTIEGVPGQVILTDLITDITTGIGITSDTIEIVGYGTVPITKGPFGTIDKVGIPSEGIPITRTPNIVVYPPPRKPFVPVTKLIVDPVNVPQDTVIQITDLAGLKQTGYIEGRAYYGEVFFKDGTPFAGRYETAGKLIQVYATLQESIDAEVTTTPSAIQRSGTDVNSNNPRLNIPGTPNNLA